MAALAVVVVVVAVMMVMVIVVIVVVLHYSCPSVGLSFTRTNDTFFEAIFGHCSW